MFPADEQPFLDAIVDRPADDEPRLVYADYLDETGNAPDSARAELIRVQIALDRLLEDDPRHAELADRQNELLEAYRPVWTAPLSNLGARFQFRRGLPDSVSLDAAAFLSRGEELFDNTQVRSGRSFVRRIRLEEPARVLAALVHASIVNQIVELDLSECDLGNGGASALAGSPHLSRLNSLSLGHNRLGDAGVFALVRATSLAHLEILELNDNGLIGHEGVASLAGSPVLAGLVELDLTGNEVNELAIRALVRGPAMRNLMRLRLGNNPLREGIVELVQSDLFGRMIAGDSRLDLHRCGIEPAGAEALAASPALGSVTGLNLNENYLGDAGVLALCRSGRLANLRTLRLVRNQITDAGAIAIVAASLPRLKRLELANNRLTRRGVDALKAAAAARGFAVEAANNGTEPTAALPTSPARTEAIEFAELKRRIAHPARPPS